MNKNEFEQFLNERAKESEIELSKENTEKLYIYMNNLLEWNERINLTAINDEKDIIVKHFIDSIFVNKFVDGNRLLDIGSGAGFPGIPLKIVNDDLEVTLVDAVNKKVKFMQDSIEKLQLKNIESLHARAEDLAHDNNYREQFDVVVSRAVSNMSTLVEYMLPFTKVGGKCLCLKGPNYEEELEISKNAIKKLGGKISNVISYSFPCISHLQDVAPKNGCKNPLQETVTKNDVINRYIIVVDKIHTTEQIYPRKQGKPLKEPIR